MEQQDLSAQASWLRALAFSLVRDEHRAHDLAQDTLVVALEEGDSARGPLRPWLGGVLENLVRQSRRRERRRRDHERLAYEPREIDEPERELARRGLIERMLDELARLDEPYRSTLSLRFQDGLSPRAIAARTDTPVRTVHTRITRGLARLRERLDGERRGRSWAAFLGPLIARERAPLSAQAIASGVLVLIAGGIVVVLAWAGSDRLPSAGLASPPDDVARLATRRAPSSDRGGDRERLAAAADDRAAEPGLVARVVTLGGLPVTGVDVTFQADGGETLVATSSSDGRVTFGGRARAGVLAVRGRPPGPVRWVGVGPVDVGRDAGEPTLFVTTSKPWTGRVFDRRGRPVPRATVVIEGGWREPGGRSTLLRRVAGRRTDEYGAFALQRVPVLPRLRISAWAPGYREATLDLDPSDNVEVVRLWLAVSDGALALAGRVVDGTATPVAGAWIASGSAWTRSRPDGSFELVGDELGDDVVAVAAGRAPIRRARRAAFVELVLSEPSLVLAGRVVDASGRPVAAAPVWIADPEPFVHDTRARFVETAIAGRDREAAVTDDAGRFEVAHLADRPYTLRVVDPTTLAVLERRARPGGPFEVSFPVGELAPVHGVVHDRAGRPVAGTVVMAFATALSVPGPDGWLVTREVRGPWCRTDANGRFDLGPLTRGELTLVVRPTRGRETRVTLWPETERGGLTVVAGGLQLVRVAVHDERSPASAFRLLDERGRPLRLIARGSGAAPDPRTTSFGAPIRGVCSELMFADEGAVTLELLAGPDVLRRIPIRLVPGELNLFEF